MVRADGPPQEWCAGARRGTRTPDPLITNQVLYQLSYTGNRSWAYAAPSAGDATAGGLGAGRGRK